MKDDTDFSSSTTKLILGALFSEGLQGRSLPEEGKKGVLIFQFEDEQV